MCTFTGWYLSLCMTLDVTRTQNSNNQPICIQHSRSFTLAGSPGTHKSSQHLTLSNPHLPLLTPPLFLTNVHQHLSPTIAKLSPPPTYSHWLFLYAPQISPTHSLSNPFSHSLTNSNRLSPTSLAHSCKLSSTLAHSH